MRTRELTTLANRVHDSGTFLGALWPASTPAAGMLVLALRLPPARAGEPDRWVYHWGQTADLEAAARYAIRPDTMPAPCAGQLYIGACRQDAQAALEEARRREALRAERSGRRPRPLTLLATRGYSHTATAAPGLWADIDIAGPAHAGGHLPPTVDAALEHVFHGFPLPPTAVVHSGHGLHAWWAFVRPWEFAGPEDREPFAALVRRFQATLAPGERRAPELPSPDRPAGDQLVAGLPPRGRAAFLAGRRTVYHLVEWVRQGHPPGAVLAAAVIATCGDAEAGRKLFFQAIAIARRQQQRGVTLIQ